MSSKDRDAPTEVPAPEAAGVVDDLATLVDDAVKALSIGGSFQAVDDVRQAVDWLKQLGDAAKTK